MHWCQSAGSGGGLKDLCFQVGSPNNRGRMSCGGGANMGKDVKEKGGS